MCSRKRESLDYIDAMRLHIGKGDIVVLCFNSSSERALTIRYADLPHTSPVSSIAIDRKCTTMFDDIA